MKTLAGWVSVNSFQSGSTYTKNKLHNRSYEAPLFHWLVGFPAWEDKLPHGGIQQEKKDENEISAKIITA